MYNELLTFGEILFRQASSKSINTRIPEYINEWIFNSTDVDIFKMDYIYVPLEHAKVLFIDGLEELTEKVIINLEVPIDFNIDTVILIDTYPMSDDDYITQLEILMSIYKIILNNKLPNIHSDILQCINKYAPLVIAYNNIINIYSNDIELFNLNKSAIKIVQKIGERFNMDKDDIPYVISASQNDTLTGLLDHGRLYNILRNKEELDV